MNTLVGQSISPEPSIRSSTAGSLAPYAETSVGGTTTAAAATLSIRGVAGMTALLVDRAEVSRWSPSRVAHWLQHSVGIEEQYAMRFMEHEIDGQTLLLDIDEACLRDDLDIRKLGIRKRIYRAITTLRGQPASRPSWSASPVTSSSLSPSGSILPAMPPLHHPPVKRQRLNVDCEDDRFWSNSDIGSVGLVISSNSNSNSNVIERSHSCSAQSMSMSFEASSSMAHVWLPYHAVKDPLCVDDRSDHIDELSAFQWIASTVPRQYPGHAAYVQSRMKRYLLGRISSSTEWRAQKAGSKFRAVVADPCDDGENVANEHMLEDDVLPLYGESDYSDTELDEAYKDVEEASDVQEASSSTAALLPVSAGCMTAEACSRHTAVQPITAARKREIIKEYSDQLLVQWQSTRKSSMLSKRLPKMIDTISHASYTTEKSVTAACGALDRTLYYIYDLSWKIGLFAQTEAPMRPVRRLTKTASTTSTATANAGVASHGGHPAEDADEQQDEEDHLSDFIDDSELNPDAPASLRDLMAMDDDDQDASMADATEELPSASLLDELIQLPTFQAMSMPARPEADEVAASTTDTAEATSSMNDNDNDASALIDLSSNAIAIPSPQSPSHDDEDNNEEVARTSVPQYVSISSSSSPASSRSSSPIMTAIRSKSPTTTTTTTTASRRVSQPTTTSPASTLRRPHTATPIGAPSASPQSKKAVAATKIDVPGRGTATLRPVGQSKSSGIGSLSYNNVEMIVNWTDEVAERTIRNCRCPRTRVPSAIRRSVRNYLDLPSENLFSRIENLARWSAFQGNTLRPPGSYSSESVNARPVSATIIPSRVDTPPPPPPAWPALRKVQPKEDYTPRASPPSASITAASMSSMAESDDAHSPPAALPATDVDMPPVMSIAIEDADDVDSTATAASEDAPPAAAVDEEEEEGEVAEDEPRDMSDKAMPGRRDIREIREESMMARMIRRMVTQKAKQIDARIADANDANDANEPWAINPGHADDAPSIAIPAFLADHLKPHQCLSDTPANIPDKLRDGRVVIVCPPTVMDNWINEFTRWIPPEQRYMMRGLYTIGESSMRLEKLNTIDHWYRNGGVLLHICLFIAVLVSYQFYRDFVTNARQLNDPTQQAMVARAFLEPGPSIVVADEGHIIKNPRTMISSAFQRIATKARICLTGSPLQNDLEEYWCMVDWVCPNYLGQLEGFRNRYINPINNGLFHDSTPADKKAYVLEKHKLGATLFQQYQSLLRICNHPHIAQMVRDQLLLKRMDHAKANAHSAASVEGVHVCDVDHDDEEEDPGASTTTILRNIGSGQGIELNDRWMKNTIDREPDVQSIRHSSKMVILVAIVTACLAARDKVLVFSRSLPTLGMAWMSVIAIDCFAKHPR
ncbi:hypothetical protein SYNPS1DRAFT_26501 [Syncephalis pseudoplumigaleata]|uniref:SAM domain-containing protein n=1 Tax=Syncephalis pseudoplumigaleata TaxID=1712513 RepID=A0A4P9Z801_9FUNG|nr:hypothetical protein SYNPS1DRAFT_26501 [Syncephalis pseudoplumigaleata]|eukprot:RKP27860.1 hypothetical protein SYNPS1DRAFT_26501 [Syncephalis pseudoplumigaleata]